MVKANNGANLGFEQKLWQAADKLRDNMDAAEYKHVVLGLIFLKYISDAFNELHEKLKKDPNSDPEDSDEYKAENVFWVPKKARWNNLQINAKKPEIGKIIDDAMDLIEKENRSLKGILPKDYARSNLDKQRLGELIDLIGTIGLGDKENRSKDILGKVYEYFLGQFADAEGKKGGQELSATKSNYVYPQSTEVFEYSHDAEITGCFCREVTIPTKQICRDVTKYRDIQKQRTITEYRSERQCN